MHTTYILTSSCGCHSVISVMSDSWWPHLAFSWQRYWSGLLFPSPTHFTDDKLRKMGLSDLFRVIQLVSVWGQIWIQEFFQSTNIHRYIHTCSHMGLLYTRSSWVAKINISFEIWITPSPLPIFLCKEKKSPTNTASSLAVVRVGPGRL